MYGIQSQERRYHYSGIAVPVCWNSSAIPAGIFRNTTGLFPDEIRYEEDDGELKEVLYRHTGGGKYERASDDTEDEA